MSTYVSTAAERETQSKADMATLSPITQATTPVRCYRCSARVYVYATSADGLRHYCSCRRALIG